MYIESGLDIGPGMEISLPPYPSSIEYLLVAGGGGGGTLAGGGGGGFLTGTYNIPASATITTTVGAAGAAAPSAYTTGGTGGNSSFVNDIDIVKSGSVYLNGSNQYLTTPNNSVFEFGTGDFTVEGWFNFSSISYTSEVVNPLISFGYGANSPSGYNNVWSLIFVNGAIYWYSYIGGATPYFTFTPPVPLRTGAWYHIAATRSGTDLRMFLNGYQVGTTQTCSFDYVNGGTTAGDPLQIGSWYGNGQTLGNFNFSNIRIVKGTAVYTTNFTPSRNALTATQAANVNGSPSAAITGTQTSLLLNTVYGANYLNDSSSYNLTITNVNSATSQTTEPIYTVTSYGGGGGGGYAYNPNGLYGGSGGGSGGGTIGAGFVGQGYDGGLGFAAGQTGGGGGGAGGVGGGGGSIAAGSGGVGTISAITGTSYYWAGGGGGSSSGVPGAPGGAGGGQGGLGTTIGAMGTGYNNATTGGAGTNTGGGGGGHWYNPTSNSGGSGIIVFRYPAIFNAATATTGSPIYSTVDGYRVYIFTGSGSITF